jgi:hypothetical protein
MSDEASLIASEGAVAKCLSALAGVMNMDVIELWTHGQDGFVLIQTYVNENSLANHTALISTFHSGEVENVTSRNLCVRALQSKHGFYWLAKKHKRIHEEIPLHTAVCITLPRDNINTDVFLITYSLQYIKVLTTHLSTLRQTLFLDALSLHPPHNPYAKPPPTI